MVYTNDANIRVLSACTHGPDANTNTTAKTSLFACLFVFSPLNLAYVETVFTEHKLLLASLVKNMF